MSIVDGIIKAPVSIEDVAKTLGVNSLDVGTLCTSDHIKMWSRFKPVKIGLLFTEATTGVQAWWKGSDGSCGISAAGGKASSWTGIPALYSGDGKNGWKYLPPTGGITSPFRLTDFNGYDHAASPPVLSMDVPEKVKRDDTLYVSFEANDDTDDESQPGSLSLKDITLAGISTLYYGIVVTDSAGKTLGRVSGGDTVGYSVVGLSSPTEYKVYPFLTNKQIGQYANDEATTVYYTMPELAPVTFKIASAEEVDGVYLAVTAEYVNSITVSYTVSVLSVGTRTFQSCYIRLRFAENDDSDDMEAGEVEKSLGSFSLSAGGTKAFTGTLSVQPNRTYVVIVRLISGTTTYTYGPEEIDQGEKEEV